MAGRPSDENDKRPAHELPDDLPDEFRLAGGGGGELDEALFAPDQEIAPEVEFAQARSRMQLRGVVFVVVLLAATWAIFGWPVGVSTVSDFAYFLQGGGEPVDLGDLRARRAAGEKRLDVPNNSYVRMSNLVMTYEAESDSYQYFYCPLFDVITRTPGPLPVKDVYRSVEIPGDLVWLVEKRLAFAEDLTAGFSGEGRLVRADQADRYRYLYDAYARTVTAPAPPEETWIFLAGDRPSTYWPYAAGYAIALLLVGMTGWFFLRAIRLYRRVRASLS